MYAVTSAVRSPTPWLTLVFALTSIFASAAQELQVPSGFTVERVSGNELRFPMFATLDERGRLYVTESSGQDLYTELQKQVKSCRISCLENQDAAGHYQTQKTFAEGLVPSMGLAWHAGKLYTADPPDLVTLEDTDGDGRADRRTVILTGFGHSDNGSLHGIIFGPDGWLYCTTGQPDGYRFLRKDGSVLEGRSGALIRCRPDGSDVEVVARGFENLMEVVFLPTGEIIGTDNWFQLPDDGIRDALVHLVVGGLYPREADRGTPQPVSGRLLPAIAKYPAVAFSGLELYRGPGFPGSMRGSLFSAQHNTRKIVRHALKRMGSTFQTADEDFVWTDDPDFHPSDVLEDRDGSLLLVDTGSWYVHHCPTGRIRRSPALGGIHRVRWNGASAAREQDIPPLSPAEQLAGDIRSLTRKGDNMLEVRLPGLLQHEASYVQLAAAEALVRSGSTNDVPSLIARIAEPADPLIEHALIHALFRLADTPQLLGALSHPNPQVQRAAMILLDQPPRNALSARSVTDRLFAQDVSLREAAHTSLQRHPDWAEQALPMIERLLTPREPSLEELDSLQKFVVAFAQQPAVVALVARAVVSDAGVSESLRVALLNAMAKTHREKLPDLWRQAFTTALRSSAPSVRTESLHGVSSLRLEGADDALHALSRDNALSNPLRVEALRAMTRPSTELSDADFALVERQLQKENAPAHRLAAVELLTLRHLQSTQFLRFLNAVEGDPLISPHSVLTALPHQKLSLPATETLLTYLNAKLGSGWQLTEAQFGRIREVTSSERAAQLDDLLNIARKSSERQQEQLAELEPLLHGGSADRGRVIFREKTACTSCHRVRGNGGVLGPDLSRIGSIRAGRDLIESIVMPSATFAQGYETFGVNVEGGDQIVGIRVRQADDSMVLRDVSGAERRIPEAWVAKVERQKHSLMPEGLLSALDREEIRDLFAFLRSLR